jgi:ribonuclease T1
VKQLKPVLTASTILIVAVVLYLIGAQSGGSDTSATDAVFPSGSPTTAVAVATPPETNRPAEQATFVPFSDLEIVARSELPAEALDTLADIASGGPYDFSRDDSVFQNREGILPDRQQGHYREYTVITTGSDDRGARRIVAGSDGELYYTCDHYGSFREIET